MAKAKNKVATPDNGSKTASDAKTAIERVQLARHPDRPYTLDFIERLFEEFVELHGDRRFAEDPAII
ncbi:MAG: acetyl-CoA carboxylase carboxyl transferase subunit alpha, partial [Pyrinomonadaceae bacterium]